MIVGTQSLARFLEKVKKGPTPSSEVRKTDLIAVRNLEDLGFINKEKKGNGQIYLLDDCSGYRQWELNIFPEGTLSASISGKTRSEAGRTLRDTKRSSQSDPSIEIRIHGSEESADVGSLNWYYKTSNFAPKGTIVLIENLRTFLSSEEIFPDAEIAIRYDGIISDEIINIVQELEGEILIAPDYDPVGILSYHRLFSKIKNRTKLFVPEDIKMMFESYSNKSLMAKNKNKSTLKSLLNKNLDEKAIYIIALIQKYNAGLEQETLHN
jgi:hypothetical protein